MTRPWDDTATTGAAACPAQIASDGQRRITDLRRVTLSARLARPLGIQSGVRVVVSIGSEDPEVIRIAETSDVVAGGAREAARPRVVTAGGQVTSPALLMTTVGLGRGDRVYFDVDAERFALRLVSAKRIRARGWAGRG